MSQFVLHSAADIPALSLPRAHIAVADTAAAIFRPRMRKSWYDRRIECMLQCGCYVARASDPASPHPSPELCTGVHRLRVRNDARSLRLTTMLRTRLDGPRCTAKPPDPLRSAASGRSRLSSPLDSYTTIAATLLPWTSRSCYDPRDECMSPCVHLVRTSDPTSPSTSTGHPSPTRSLRTSSAREGRGASNNAKNGWAGDRARMAATRPSRRLISAQPGAYLDSLLCCRVSPPSSPSSLSAPALYIGFQS
ncbi:hypothetical protein DFH09DRAFT_1169286 [Mycena vulgaris]|nr:hypothetical protein DFH09DRAFT_1169286 [Mycena vulgaris]